MESIRSFATRIQPITPRSCDVVVADFDDTRWLAHRFASSQKGRLALVASGYPVQAEDGAETWATATIMVHPDLTVESGGEVINADTIGSLVRRTALGGSWLGRRPGPSEMATAAQDALDALRRDGFRRF